MAVKIRKLKNRISLKTAALSMTMGLAALAALVYLGVSNWRILQDRQAVEAEVDKLERQIQVLKERRQMLEAGLSAAQGEGFLEEKMREQGYKKPGEEVIAVLPGETSDVQKQEAQGNDNFWLNLWQKIKNLKP